MIVYNHQLKRPWISATMSLFSSFALQKQQQEYLSMRYGLYELFDQIQMQPIFNIPENSLVINLDNITFGPKRYTVTLPLNSHLHHQIVYYSILYSIFQGDNMQENLRLYEELLFYIMNTSLDFQLEGICLTEIQIKVYLIKFLNLLWGGRGKNKLIVEELKNLPHIDLLLRELFIQITGFRDFNIDTNGRVMEENIKKKIGFFFQFLSYELMIFSDKYQLEIRNFDSICQFSISHESNEKIELTRNEFYMGQSACFKIDSTPHLCGEIENHYKNKCKVTKKDTVKSIEWDFNREQSEEEFEEIDQQPTINHHIFDQNSTLLVSIPNVSFFQSNSKDLVQTQDYTFHCREDGIKRKNQDKFINFEQIKGLQKNQNDLGLDIPTSTVRSTTFNQEEQILASPLYRFDHPKKSSITKNNSLTCILPIFSYATSELIASYSTTCIKTDGFSEYKAKRRAKRTPSFIFEREKAKQLSTATNTTQTSSNAASPPSKKLLPRITFSYRMN